MWRNFLNLHTVSKIEVRIHLVFVLYRREVVFILVDRSILQQKTVQLTRNMKNVLHPTPWRTYSHSLFHQFVHWTTVMLGFHQICTMTYDSSRFRCSLLLLVLFVASQALAKPGNNANSTPVSSAATKHCNNVYNSFYAGPNKKIETILQEMKIQLTQLQDDINILKGNKTTVKGKICFCVETWILGGFWTPQYRKKNSANTALS